MKKLNVISGTSIKETKLNEFTSHTTFSPDVVDETYRLLESMDSDPNEILKRELQTNNLDAIALIGNLSRFYPNINIEFFIDNTSVGENFDKVFEHHNASLDKIQYLFEEKMKGN